MTAAPRAPRLVNPNPNRTLLVLAAGGLAYVAVLLRSGQPEARQLVSLFARRFGRTA